MTVRPRRPLSAASAATGILLLLAAASVLTAQQAPAGAPPAAPHAPAKAAPPQTGLPPEFVIPVERLAQERKDLEALDLYLKANRPPSGIGAITGKIGGWFSGLLSGKKKPRGLALSVIVEAAKTPTTANQLTGQLVSVEGLYEKGAKKDQLGPLDFLLEGDSRLRVLPWGNATAYYGFSDARPDGLPALATGAVVMQPTGPVLQVQEIRPAPTLTSIRLARTFELEQEAASYSKALALYQQASASTGPGAVVWAGFAMAHGGEIAQQKVLDRKAAIKLYQLAWNRDTARKTPGVPAPQTWVLVGNAQWEKKPLREAVGKPLDALESTGFWYKFVDAVVAISGGNAGIGMIVLALITRLLLWPLTKKQMQSAKEMQKLQPQIKALQEKHGSDKQKFQEDFWKLCKSHNVNPFGGCLPLVIQMPLLWMVYSGVRAYTVQLAGHHFLWVRSLADPDMPLLVLYTISMVAFQKLTMKNQPVSDAQQQQQQNMMVWMMPLMFFVFFQSIASGFILYWLGTNLIYLPQQYFAMRPRKEEGEEGSSKERVITLEPGGTSRAPNSTGGAASESMLDRVKGWLGGQKTTEKRAEEGPAAPSYEQKRAEEKREQRRAARKRKRRV
jgi:YidC/Oxa1 family membrane protein insertase